MTTPPMRILLALPLLGFVLLGAYLAIEAIRPGTLTAPPATTVSEAVAGGDAARALELVAAGADLNRPWPVRAGWLGPEAVELTPLDAAVASGRVELVALLLRAGADPVRAPDAICRARQILPAAIPLLAGSEPDVEARLAGCR